MRLSVDTNAYRAFVDGNSAIVEAVQQAEAIAFSVVVLAELKSGFRYGSREAENQSVLSRILSKRRVRIHEITSGTTEVYASVWSDLRKKGLPIPTNDVWIAALCLEKDFTLLTLDSHFQSVTGLRVCPLD